MRAYLLAVPLALLAGCYVRTYQPYQPYAAGPAPAPAPRAEVYYYGNHFIPDVAGGGWCYIDGPHTHDYYPDRDDWYAYDQGYYWYQGPFMFAYFGGHPLPGGGWCFLSGPHQHDYYPPYGGDWRWNRTGYVYQGEYRPNRPPPATYWARPAPRVDWRTSRPSVRPAPAPPVRPMIDGGRPSPGPDRGWNGRTQPGGGYQPPPAAPPPPIRPMIDGGRPSPGPDRGWDGRRPDAGYQAPPAPGHSGDAPGHGGTLPPGQGGIPPGQRPGFTPPGHDRQESPPPRAAPWGAPPGHDDRGGGRGQEDRRDRFAPQPAAPAPSPAPAPARPEPKEKKEKKDKKDEAQDERPRGFFPGRR